jgi:hypothetical protein
MATSPTTRSALLSGAAKNDMLGQDGDFIFNINDLLANDPGGAAKVDITKQFFFGDTAADQANQGAYLTAHGITDNHDGTFTIGAGATDFNYFVQIGNKGTWSTASVDVTAPVPVPHAGDALFTENFDHYNGTIYQDGGVNVFASVNMEGPQAAPPAGQPGAIGEWSNASHTELGADGYGGILDTSPGAGGFWFDTQNSPGPVNISHTFTDTTAAPLVPHLGPPPAPPSQPTAVLSFDIAKQDLTYQGQHYATDPNASFEFRIDGTQMIEIKASDLLVANDMVHFDVNLYYDNGSNTHTLTMADTSATAGFTGFAVDSIQIHDWVI